MEDQREEEEQSRMQRCLEALSKIARVVDADYQTLCDHVLVEIAALTQSRYAFWGFLNEDASLLTLHAWSKEAMEDCQIRDRTLERPIATAGLWADAVRQGKPLIVNDYQAGHPSKRGLPAGHVPLTRILAVPIFSRGRIVALAVVANKPSDYQGEDARLIDSFVSSVEVILERGRAEEELRRVNRALRTLSRCNQILVRATDEAELLQGICKAIVDLGGYVLAWVGFAGQDEAKGVRPVAQAGYEEGYLDTVNITWADTERGRGPTGSAIRSVQPSIIRNMLTGPDYAPWRAEATRRGFASSIALPLTASGGTFGALNIYATDADAFDEEELKLLMELAADLAYGIGALRARAERKQAEEALLESNRRLEETLAELRRTQQQIIQQERLHALGEMASGIAHDFNNILTPILGYTDLLLSRPEDLANRQRVVEYLGTINTAARDAADIVRRLREFYRYREETESFQPVNLSQLVEQAVSLTEPRWKSQAQSQGVTINVEADLREVPPVAGSESELRSALTNLVFNAVEAMPQGGTITFCTYPDGEHVVLEVCDTGIGMTEEIRRHCMEPFFTTKRESGSGLGLSTVYGTVQRHEGTIDIESQVGKETTFTIRLPAQAREKAESRGQQEVEAPPHPLRILVVDDEPVVRQVIARYLLGEGHAVETAASGLVPTFGKERNN